MIFTPDQISQAKIQQDNAAHDEHDKVRLIAGPGTGKSHTIQERVAWLLKNGTNPEAIFVVSFTRASALDLRIRIRDYCQENGCPNPEYVRVSTLHSLALQILRKANRLNYYPGTPVILDDWEVKRAYDVEFSCFSDNKDNGKKYTPSRCEEIRKDYEALCETGQYSPPNFIPPDPPITTEERHDFVRFHNSRNQVYSCVLPGDLVKDCVFQIESGTFDIVSLLGITHLIVDEYQDLNPVDIRLIDLLIRHDISTFIAGDDDQSIYSFRYAFPRGIQSFTNSDRFPDASSHEITHCFRCTPNILDSAQTLIHEFSEPSRLPKQTQSLFSDSIPPIPGHVFRWHFQRDLDEANAIGLSCQSLINRGLSPEKILILVSNTNIQLRSITHTLENLGLPYDSPREVQFIETELGRFIYGMIRIVCDNNDYFAHRLLLGLFPRIGPITCNNIANIIFANNLNYKDIFYTQSPSDVFNKQQLGCINKIKQICSILATWDKEDTLTSRNSEINMVISNLWGSDETVNWQDYIGKLPQDLTLLELREYMGMKFLEQKNILLRLIYDRLQLQKPINGFIPPKIRIMTMHGAKGLSGEIVFVPGLEESILPGIKKSRYPGLVFEAARMLYVAITRARISCVFSYVDQRYINGTMEDQIPSRFLPHLNGRFQERETGFTDQEINRIIESITYT